MQRTFRFLALTAALLLSPAAHANSVDIFTGSVEQGTLSGVSVTFVGYTSPGVTSNVQANTATVSPASPANLVSIANTWFGTTSFVAADEHRTPIDDGPISLVLDIETLYFSLTIGRGGETAFFRNDSGGAVHLTYTGLPGGGNGVSHYSEFGAALAVPGPIVGAGLPGLMMALGGLVILARRRRDRSAFG